MTWITNTDYLTVIRSNVETMVTDATPSVKRLAESAALEEVKGYLRGSACYDVPYIFGHRAFDHEAANAYLKNDLAIDGSYIQYVALQDVPTGTALTETAYWLKDEQKTPQAHSSATEFSKGDTVTGPNEEQYLVIQDTGANGRPLTDREYFWLKRNGLLLMILLDVTVYHLHQRIHAKQIPQVRIDRYDMAVAKLKSIKKKEIVLAAPAPVMEEGEKPVGIIAVTSQQKRDNNWFAG